MSTVTDHIKAYQKGYTPTGHIVIDVETASEEVEAIVLSLGAAAIYHKSELVEGRTVHSYLVGSSFYGILPLHNQVQLGRKTSLGTAEWWRTSVDPEARIVWTESALCINGFSALSDFWEWIYSTSLVVEKDPIVYGNGPSFDNAILQHLYRQIGIPLPWSFRNEGCFRTLRRLCPTAPRVKPTLPHHAECDAIAEAKTLIEIAKVLQNTGVNVFQIPD